ncbi:MAG: hypothetical protein LBJ96_02200 [Holosporaceae bacterium]|jgi:hypothetical protein|nr:hypothetical protein [Holosporaceae bacterium]
MINIERYENKTTIEANKKNAGYENVCRAYHKAQAYASDTLIFDNFIREDAVAATADELKIQGVVEFVFSSKAGNMYDILALFQENGYRIKEMTKVATDRIDFSVPLNENMPKVINNALLLVRK